jgi:hypothetical protein
MKLDKKQIPQLIVLGVLVIVCIGYVSFSVFSPKQAAPRPPAEKAASTAASEAETSASQESAVLPPGEFPEMMGATVRRDPFTPQIAATAEQLAATPKPARHGAGLKNLSGGVPPINPFKGPSGAMPGMLPVPEKEPEFVLTGIIRGAENVAIIRVGDTGRHIVREGQLIDGRYRVMRVTDDGAVLVYKNRRIDVRLGGAKNAN